jgi:hypothetical protein
MTDQEFGLKMISLTRKNKYFKEVFDKLYGIINSDEYNAKKHIPEGYNMMYAYALAFLSGNKKKGSETSLKAEEIKREVEDSIEMGIAANKKNANNAAWLEENDNDNNNTRFRKEWKHGPAFMGKLNKGNNI